MQGHALFFNRDDKNECFRYDVNNYTKCTGVPLFVNNMNQSIFSQIEGVVEFNTTARPQWGYLILFQINGRLKYCTTFDGQYFPEEV